MNNEPRRVVTGLNAEGKSCVLIDGPAIDLGYGGSRLAWQTPVPADNSGTADCAGGTFDFDRMHAGEAMFVVVDFPAQMDPFWHATNTIEYIAMLEGEFVFQTETGEVTLMAGDVLVNRGIIHSGRNDSGKPARAAITILPAHPVGNGRTV